MHDALRQLTGTLLVTGGMGFIGSNFVRHILREHPTARVVNLDKVTYAGNPRNLAEIAGIPAIPSCRRWSGIVGMRPGGRRSSPGSTGRTIAFSTASAPHERADTVGG